MLSLGELPRSGCAYCLLLGEGSRFGHRVCRVLSRKGWFDGFSSRTLFGTIQLLRGEMHCHIQFPRRRLYSGSRRCAHPIQCTFACGNVGQDHSRVTAKIDLSLPTREDLFRRRLGRARLRCQGPRCRLYVNLNWPKLPCARLFKPEAPSRHLRAS